MKDFTQMEPLDYLWIPWRRKWYWLAVCLAVIAGASIYAKIKTPMYRSETRILVESATVLDDSLSPSSSSDRAAERVNSIRQLLESRTILEQIVEEYRLRAADSNQTMEDVVRLIRTNLEVTKASGNTFAMAFYANEPQQAQKIARRLAEILISTNQRALRTRAEDKEGFLDKELTQAEEELAAATEKITQFKAGHLGELPEQGNANMNALNALHNQLIALDNVQDRSRDQQKNLEFRLGEQKRISALARSVALMEKPADSAARPGETPSPLALRLAAKRIQLAELQAKYEAGHPDVIRAAGEVKDLEDQLRQQKGSTGADVAVQPQLTPLGAAAGQNTAQGQVNADTEVAQIEFELSALKTAIAKRDKDRESILKNIDLYQKRLNLAPTLEQELLALTRESDAKKTHVDSLQQRRYNARMAANAAADAKNDVYRILDAASLPERPIAPSRLQIILMGIVAGLGAGFVATYLREYLEPSLANEGEASTVLKIPVLVSIPEIPAGPKALLK